MEIYGKLREAGLKATEQRVAVYRAMLQLGHATVDEVVRIVHSCMPAVTVATVYNILEALVEAGLVSRLYSCGSRMYDITTGDHVHVIVGNDKVIDLADLDTGIDDAGIDNIVRSYLKCRLEGRYNVRGIKVFVEMEKA